MLDELAVDCDCDICGLLATRAEFAVEAEADLRAKLAEIGVPDHLADPLVAQTMERWLTQFDSQATALIMKCAGVTRH